MHGKRGATKKLNDDRDQDVEDELYGDIVSPGGAGAGSGSGAGAALLTLQVAEVRRQPREGKKRVNDSIERLHLENSLQTLTKNSSFQHK